MITKTLCATLKIFHQELSYKVNSHKQQTNVYILGQLSFINTCTDFQAFINLVTHNEAGYSRCCELKM